jgi:hypothetical protein
MTTPTRASTATPWSRPTSSWSSWIRSVTATSYQYLGEHIRSVMIGTFSIIFIVMLYHWLSSLQQMAHPHRMLYAMCHSLSCSSIIN